MAAQYGAAQRIRNGALCRLFACITLIASDISKMCLRLMEQDEKTGIWKEATSASFSPVLRKPNRYQTRIKFIENWVVSKLSRGNTVVLKERDARGVVVALYILDWGRVKPLVAPNGSVYYQLECGQSRRRRRAGRGACKRDHPRHDGAAVSSAVRRLAACLRAAWLRCRASRSRTIRVAFFSNGATPSGVLTAPGEIERPDAERFKKEWEEKFTGQNAGTRRGFGRRTEIREDDDVCAVRVADDRAAQVDR
jgi:hypothetical protein